MSTKPEYDRGYQDGVRYAVTFLLTRAKAMNDPTAVAVLNVAADRLGNSVSQKFIDAGGDPAKIVTA